MIPLTNRCLTTRSVGDIINYDRRAYGHMHMDASYKPLCTFFTAVK